MTSAEVELRNSPKHKLTRDQRSQLVRDLAEAEVSRADLARQYGVTTSYITQFAHSRAAAITELQQKLRDAVVELWIADKPSRVAAYQDEYQMLHEHENAHHHEWSKARMQALHSVAEELGQLPPRQQVMVMPVVHLIEAVDLEELK